MRKLILTAALLPVLAVGCAQLAAFEQKAAPVIAQACAIFHRAEANPLVQIALAGGATAGTVASGLPVGAIVAEIREYGTAFCAKGPPASDPTTPDQQAIWLVDVAKKLILAAQGH